MSRNILKFHQIVVKDEKTVTIDNNEKIDKQMRKLEEIKLKEAKDLETQAMIEGFTSGLDAEEVDALTEDGEEIVKSSAVSASETLKVITAQAQEILEEARKGAEDIKSKMLMETQSEIEEIKQKALEAAQKEGYEAGYSEGLTQINSQRKIIEEEKERLDERRERLEKEYQELVSELEPKFVEILTEIYEQVFKIDLAKEQEIIMHLISATMHRVEASRNYLVHVSKEDYPYVSANKEEMLAGVMSPNASVEIVEDITLGANDCIIETDGGVFDCGLGTQLEELSQKLRLLSYTKRQ